MSVLYKNEKGWILDHLQFINNIFKDVKKDKETNNNITYKKELFNISNPFMMDSEFNARNDELTLDKSSTLMKWQHKNRRKRKTDLNEGEIKAKELHNDIIEFIILGYKSLMEDIKNQDVFEEQNKIVENNTKARKLAKQLDLGDSLRYLCKSDVNSIDIQKHALESDSVYENISNKIICNTGEKPIKIEISDNCFHIPSKSTFLMIDVKNLNHFISKLGKFDFILLDPPWQNKSVKRKKMYQTLQNEDLLSIPVPELSAPCCIVGIWVTNRVKHREFVTEELFPFWNVKYVTTWYWLKVTKSGEMVYDIHSNHKKPYEMLILGEFEGQYEEEVIKREQSSLKQNDLLPKIRIGLPLDQTIISVPSSIHSMKVPLSEIMADFLPDNPTCLEIFARNLQTGWVSVGNEVYKHNHVDYFEKT